MYVAPARCLQRRRIRDELPNRHATALAVSLPFYPRVRSPKVHSTDFLYVEHSGCRLDQNATSDVSAKVSLSHKFCDHSFEAVQFVPKVFIKCIVQPV